MNRKCFCCFNNMNKDDNDDELLQDWMELSTLKYFMFLL